MKKLIFGIFIALIVASCTGNLKNNNNQTPGDSSEASEKKALDTTIDKTLNGFDGGDARARIKNFADSFVIDGNLVSDDTGKKSVYTWYNLDQIRNIDSLLIKEKADGMRIYLGADKISSGSKKLKVHLFMVSTRKRISGDPAGSGSAHIDYYGHTAAYLNGTQPFGDGIDDDAVNGPKNGAFLYDKPNITTAQFPTVPCDDKDPHFVPNDSALNWVQRRGDWHTAKSDPTGYNTRSEWFECPFITTLFSIIADTNNHFSGLRIYMGKGKIDKKTGRVRDVFILVPTKKDGGVDKKDDYECMAKFFKNSLKGAEAMGTSDNGELCPDVCN